MMKKFEYMSFAWPEPINIPILNSYGQEGWELALVAFTEIGVCIVYLKREIINDPAKT